MVRILLALLAVLTGIAAIGQPVAARVSASETSALHRIDCAAAPQASADSAAIGIPENPAPDVRADTAAMRSGAPIVPSRTVLIRCDRALE